MSLGVSDREDSGELCRPGSGAMKEEERLVARSEADRLHGCDCSSLHKTRALLVCYCTDEHWELVIAQ